MEELCRLTVDCGDGVFVFEARIPELHSYLQSQRVRVNDETEYRIEVGHTRDPRVVWVRLSLLGDQFLLWHAQGNGSLRRRKLVRIFQAVQERFAERRKKRLSFSSQFRVA